MKKTLERVDGFEFLGTMISCNGKADKKILNRAQKAMSAYQISNLIVGKDKYGNTTTNSTSGRAL